MKQLAVLLFIGMAAALPVSAASATPCITLAHQSYCRVWSAKNASMSKTEFLRSGETVDRWQNMITVLRYNGLTMKEAIAHYMSIVRNYMGPDDHPVWIQPTHGPHAEAAATRLVLVSPGVQGEYVVVYFFKDPGQPVYQVAFSQHLPLPSHDVPSMAQYGKWLDDMQAMPAAAVAAK